MTCAIHQFRWKLYYIVLYENKLHVTTWLAFGVEHDSFTLVFRQDCRAGVSLAGCSIFDRWAEGNEMYSFSLHYVIYEFTFVY